MAPNWIATFDGLRTGLTLWLIMGTSFKLMAASFPVDDESWWNAALSSRLYQVIVLSSDFPMIGFCVLSGYLSVHSGLATLNGSPRFFPRAVLRRWLRLIGPAALVTLVSLFCSFDPDQNAFGGIKKAHDVTAQLGKSIRSLRVGSVSLLDPFFLISSRAIVRPLTELLIPDGVGFVGSLSDERAAIPTLDLVVNIFMGSIFIACVLWFVALPGTLSKNQRKGLGGSDTAAWTLRLGGLLVLFTGALAAVAYHVLTDVHFCSEPRNAPWGPRHLLHGMIDLSTYKSAFLFASNQIASIPGLAYAITTETLPPAAMPLPFHKLAYASQHRLWDTPIPMQWAGFTLFGAMLALFVEQAGPRFVMPSTAPAPVTWFLYTLGAMIMGTAGLLRLRSLDVDICRSALRAPPTPFLAWCSPCKVPTIPKGTALMLSTCEDESDAFSSCLAPTYHIAALTFLLGFGLYLAAAAMDLGTSGSGNTLVGKALARGPWRAVSRASYVVCLVHIFVAAPLCIIVPSFFGSVIASRWGIVVTCLAASAAVFLGSLTIAQPIHFLVERPLIALSHAAIVSGKNQLPQLETVSLAEKTPHSPPPTKTATKFGAVRKELPPVPMGALFQRRPSIQPPVSAFESSE